jgi:hypothetical protein
MHIVIAGLGCQEETKEIAALPRLSINQQGNIILLRVWWTPSLQVAGSIDTSMNQK